MWKQGKWEKGGGGCQESNRDKGDERIDKRGLQNGAEQREEREVRSKA